MGVFNRWVLAGLIVIGAGGCGSATHHSDAAGSARATNSSSYARVAEGSCATGESDGKPLKTSCVFTLADGRRFTCPQRFAQMAQTASSLDRSTACRTMSPLHLSIAVRRVTASIESVQVCLTSDGVRAIGNAVLPALAAANGPDGELIAGHLPDGALIAFYRTVAKAKRLEPAVLRNARRLDAQVERHGTVTVFWSRPPAATLRRAVQGCLTRA